MNPEKRYLVDTNQTAWQLAAIQLAGWMSLPILVTSLVILQQNSFLGAALTLLVGNAILWFIRLGMVAMSRESRQSSLDVAHAYLGKLGGYFIAALFLISTLTWFITQTDAASSALTSLITIRENPSIDQFAQISVFLGLICSLLCMDGVVMLKRLATFCLPLLIVSFLAILFSLPFQKLLNNGNATSLSGLTLVLSTNLGVSSDLPTFFRHSKSWSEAMKGLFVVQIVSLILSLLGLMIGSIFLEGLQMNKSLILAPEHAVLRYSLVVFILLSVVCANVANVYSASVGWELLAPRSLVGRKEYLILGLGLTIIFILVSNVTSLEFLLEASDGGLVNLCITLVMAYVISRLAKNAPNPREKWIYFTAWFIATCVNACQFGGLFLQNLSPFGVGLSLVLLITGLGLGVTKHVPALLKWLFTGLKKR